jgi:hypothetical protein
MKTLVSIILLFATSLTPLHGADMAIDGTTRESYEKSIMLMSSSLNEDEKRLFSIGLFNIIVDRYPISKGLGPIEKYFIIPSALEAAYIHTNGISLSEILSAGQVVDTSEEARLERLDAQAKELERLRNGFEKDKDRLSKLRSASEGLRKQGRGSKPE